MAYAAGWLVDSGLRFAFLLNLSPVFVALTLIAFGTSAPEAAVGIVAAVKGQKFIALGNILGSNIANLALVLGISALIRPIRVDKSIFKKDIPSLLISSGMLFFALLDLKISRVEGGVFLVVFLGFLVLSFRNKSLPAGLGYGDKKPLANFSSWKPVLLVLLVSIGGVVLGADLMVKSGVRVALDFRVTPLFVGLTVFAVGTSLPELFTSANAAVKNQPGVSLGNVIGSNIFNVLFVLGVVSLIHPVIINSQTLRVEGVFFLLFSFGTAGFLRWGYNLGRIKALFLLAFYFLFLWAVYINNKV